MTALRRPWTGVLSQAPRGVVGWSLEVLLLAVISTVIVGVFAVAACVAAWLVTVVVTHV